MDLAGILGIALGSGTLGAGIMKIIDRWYEHRLARKDKKQDCAALNMDQMSCDVQDHKQRIKSLEEDKQRRDLSEQAMLKALNALLLHAMTGNATGKMQTAQENLVDSIIEN